MYLEVRQKVWVMEVESPAGALRPEERGTEHTDDERIAADAAVSDVLGRVGKAQRPVLWGGEMLQRLGLQTDFETLVRTANLPYTTTLMSKGMISKRIRRMRSASSACTTVPLRRLRSRKRC